VIASTVASTYPVASASSSVVYVYDPALDTPVRQVGVAGPILGERAETIGKGQFDLGVSYSYVHLTTINGEEMDSLLNKPRVNGKTLQRMQIADGLARHLERLGLERRAREVADLTTYLGHRTPTPAPAGVEGQRAGGRVR